jgi:hypothetical protein
MASSVRQAFGENQPQAAQQQDPREVALSRMKQMGINIPRGMENDPKALIQYVTQNGFVPQERVSMAQQMIQKMFGRR